MRTLPFAALLAFMVISLLAPQTFVPALGALRPALLTAAVAIAALVADRVVRRLPLVTVTGETWIVAALAAWATASIPASYWPGGSAPFMFDRYVKTLAVYWLLGTVVDSRRRVRLVAWTLSLVAVPLAVTGVRNYLVGAFVSGGGPVSMQRIVGYDAPLTENPNDLALMLNLILPLTVALLLVQRRGVVRLLLTAVVLTDVLAVILTFSRAGFLTLATTLVLYGRRLVRGPERSWVMLALLLMLAAVAVLPSSYVDRLGTITSIDSDPTGSAQARWADTMAAASYVLSHPIVGAGIGMNILALNEERGARWKDVHNVYLELAVDLGIPGLILFLVLLVRTIRSVARVRRSVSDDAELFHLAQGLQIGLIAFAVAGLFYPVAYNFYFYLLAGLAVALQAVSRTRWNARASGC